MIQSPWDRFGEEVDDGGWEEEDLGAGTACRAKVAREPVAGPEGEGEAGDGVGVDGILARRRFPGALTMTMLLADYASG